MMADFEPPSFSLGLDFDLIDSEPRITPVTTDTDPPSSNHLSAPVATFQHNHDEFQTLIVDDSDPDYPDSHPNHNHNRLRHRLTICATSSSSSPVIIQDQHIHTYTQQGAFCTSSNDREPVSASCSNAVFSKSADSPRRGFNSTESDSDTYDPAVSRKCDGSDLNSNLLKRIQNVSNAQEDFPKAYCYYFHDDPRIRELVRSRLPYFSLLGNMFNVEVEQPGTSKIDYLGQFRIRERTKQVARTINDEKSSTTRKALRKLKTEVMSQGWVNPKLGVDKVTTKGAVKRKVNTVCRTAGHWLTGSDGKKVYVGKSGQELTGRVAYMQYKKESGSGFKKVTRKSATKKKK